MQQRITVPIAKAREIAVDAGPEFTKALIELESLNYAMVDVVIEYGDDPSDPVIGLQQHDGVMVGFFLDPWVGEQIALPGGETVHDLHVTLAYIGTLDEIDVNQQRTLIGVVSELARDSHALSGVVAGMNTFSASAASEDEAPGTVPLYAGVNIPGLYELRTALLAALDDAGIPYHDDFPVFTPHVTLAYVDPEVVTPDVLDRWQLTPQPVTLRTITAAIGGAHFDSTLFGDMWGDEGIVTGRTNPPSAYRPNFTKALALEEEKRFTLAPMYLPDTLDGHGEWIDGVELEDVFHEWMADYARDGIRLQHNTEIPAGQVVEGYILREPMEVDVPIPTAA